jgi:hypothetical protein
MRFFAKIRDAFNHAAVSWTMREWIVLTAAMLIVGVICMRGYGSRKSY